MAVALLVAVPLVAAPALVCSSSSAQGYTLVALDSFTVANGSAPEALPIRNGSGYLYDTTVNGGAENHGAIFKYSQKEGIQLLASFNGSNGTNPYSAVCGDGLGGFYGTTNEGGANGKGAIFKYSASAGQIGVIYMNGATQIGWNEFVGSVPAPPKGMKVGAVKDMNGDGHPDIVLQNTTTGAIAIWYFNGVNFLSQASVTSSLPGWNVVGSGDYNNDGHPDLLMQSKSGGEIIVWYFSGASVTGYSVIINSEPTGW